MTATHNNPLPKISSSLWKSTEIPPKSRQSYPKWMTFSRPPLLPFDKHTFAFHLSKTDAPLPPAAYPDTDVVRHHFPWPSRRGGGNGGEGSPRQMTSSGSRSGGARRGSRAGSESVYRRRVRIGHLGLGLGRPPPPRRVATPGDRRWPLRFDALLTQTGVDLGGLCSRPGRDHVMVWACLIGLEVCENSVHVLCVSRPRKGELSTNPSGIISS